jgi:hypothetical protein
MDSTAPWTLAELREGVTTSFGAAAELAGGSSSDRLVIAENPVELRFASNVLRSSLLRAFTHLVDPTPDLAEQPALTVHLWDSASTGVGPPLLIDRDGDDVPGALYHVHEPPLRAVFQPGLEKLSVFDADTGTAWHWVGDAARQPFWDEACPIRQLLFWWLRTEGYLQLHGAAVGTDEGGVLVVGNPGSGKSTVALSSLDSELSFAGDDYVAVAVDPSPRVQSLYSSGKLEPHHVRELLPGLLPLLANADRLEDEKALIYVHEHFPQQTTDGFPLRAVLVPTVVRELRRPRILPATRAAAFAALAPSTMIQLHTADADAWATMSRLVERVPCYRLELGSDVSAIPGTVREFLAELSSA